MLEVRFQIAEVRFNGTRVRKSENVFQKLIPQNVRFLINISSLLRAAKE